MRDLKLPAVASIREQARASQAASDGKPALPTLTTSAPEEASQLSQPSRSQATQTQTQTQGGTQSTSLTVPSTQPRSSPGPSSQSSTSTLHLPPSPALRPAVSAAPELPPLHPTLVQLSPNPLSVIYASSLRPLPPDPNRRFTGVGVGGGAIHHRHHRKAAQLSAKGGLAGQVAQPGAGPPDLWRWYVRARASPGAGLVGKADKCLMTSDWKVAFMEQRYIRAMARIEKLKNSGEWSLRQPKKQKGPVVRKAHWDHLLEEMVCTLPNCSPFFPNVLASMLIRAILH